MKRRRSQPGAATSSARPTPDLGLEIVCSRGNAPITDRTSPGSATGYIGSRSGTYPFDLSRTRSVSFSPSAALVSSSLASARATSARSSAKSSGWMVPAHTNLPSLGSPRLISAHLGISRLISDGADHSARGGELGRRVAEQPLALVRHVEEHALARGVEDEVVACLRELPASNESLIQC